jgi:hypothetical protein
MIKLTILLLASGIAVAGCATNEGNMHMSSATAKRDADYRAALRKCDEMGSAERSTCIEDAKQRYGKS